MTDNQQQLVIDHQGTCFSTNFDTVAWRTLNNDTCTYYQMNSSICNPTLAGETPRNLLNQETTTNITLEPHDLQDEQNQLLCLIIMNAQNKEVKSVFLYRKCFRLSQIVSLCVLNLPSTLIIRIKSIV